MLPTQRARLRMQHDVAVLAVGTNGVAGHIPTLAVQFINLGMVTPTVQRAQQRYIATHTRHATVVVPHHHFLTIGSRNRPLQVLLHVVVQFLPTNVALFLKQLLKMFRAIQHVVVIEFEQIGFGRRIHSTAALGTRSTLGMPRKRFLVVFGRAQNHFDSTFDNVFGAASTLLGMPTFTKTGFAKNTAAVGEKGIWFQCFVAMVAFETIHMPRVVVGLQYFIPNRVLTSKASITKGLKVVVLAIKVSPLRKEIAVQLVAADGALKAIHMKGHGIGRDKLRSIPVVVADRLHAGSALDSKFGMEMLRTVGQLSSAVQSIFGIKFTGTATVVRVKRTVANSTGETFSMPIFVAKKHTKEW